MFLASWRKREQDMQQVCCCMCMCVCHRPLLHARKITLTHLTCANDIVWCLRFLCEPSTCVSHTQFDGFLDFKVQQEGDKYIVSQRCVLVAPGHNTIQCLFVL